MKQFYLLISTTFALALIHVLPYSTDSSIISEISAQVTEESNVEEKKNITNQSLGEPFYSEKGIITGPYTYNANGTLKDVGNVTNTGLIITKPLSNELIYGQGQGVLQSKDGEQATYTFQFIGSLKEGGQPPHGSWFIYTNSTGKMAFLNTMVGITYSEIGKEGEFSTKVWKWK
ncbi:MAG TPA: hypothetical protein VHJ38_19230 [Nitrososphaeraceae archaeon]|nr:hypothetical protein [Nitrososphaeraceae archaeon]